MNKILKENKAIQEILEKVKPYQDELTQKWVKKINEEGKIKLTDSDIELYEYKLVLDLTKALGNFLDKNDSLKDIKFDESYSSIELSCKVIRDEQIFNFSTEIIKAGGFNIQQLHLRYIVHTKLPRKKNVEYEKLNEQYKKMTKAQKIKEEISKIKQYINKTEIKINEAKENSKLSDSEIEKLSREKEPEFWKNIDTTWEEIVKRGADKNFDFDKNYFERETQQWKKSKIESWKNFNSDVKHYETIIKTQQKYIEKLNKKLSELGLTEMSKGGTIPRVIVVSDINNGKLINDLYSEWNYIKNQKDQDKWETKVQKTKFGTYGTISLLEILDKFNFNESKAIIDEQKKGFINEIKNALQKMKTGGTINKRILSALNRDKKYTSEQEWEKSYSKNRKSKVLKYTYNTKKENINPIIKKRWEYTIGGL